MSKSIFSRLSIGMVALATAALLVTLMPTQSFAQDLSYSAKVVCKDRGGDFKYVLRGDYRTVVNIHNPHDFDVFFIKKSVQALLQRDGPRRGEISPWYQEVLLPDEALAVDCVDIRQMFDPPIGSFLDGFVVIRVPPSGVTGEPPLLDVWVYYTAKQLDLAGTTQNSVATIDVEEVHPKLIGQPLAESDNEPDN